MYQHIKSMLDEEPELVPKSSILFWKKLKPLDLKALIESGKMDYNLEHLNNPIMRIKNF